MREYELVAVIRPDVPEENAVVERIQQLISSRGGEVTNLERWGKRRLAYPIKHYLEGYYVVTQFRLEPQQVADVDSGLKLSEELLRHLVVNREG